MVLIVCLWDFVLVIDFTKQSNTNLSSNINQDSVFNISDQKSRFKKRLEKQNFHLNTISSSVVCRFFLNSLMFKNILLLSLFCPDMYVWYCLYHLFANCRTMIY